MSKLLVENYRRKVCIGKLCARTGVPLPIIGKAGKNMTEEKEKGKMNVDVYKIGAIAMLMLSLLAYPFMLDMAWYVAHLALVLAVAGLWK